MRKGVLFIMAVFLLSPWGCSSGGDPCENDTVCASLKRVCQVSADGKAVCGDCFEGLFEYEDKCLDADACADQACLGHGTCERQGLNNFYCDCDEMYAGGNCQECMPPYQDNDADGTCEPSCQNTEVSCGDHGQCDDQGGTVECICETGYTGDVCDECDEATGWYPDSQDDVCTDSPLLVVLEEPRGKLYLNDSVESVTIRFSVTGPAVDGVDLYLNDMLLTSVGNPYVYQLNTKMLAEGNYSVHGEAACCNGQKSVTSESYLKIDRTPPSISFMTPTPGDDNVWIRDEIKVNFTEPLAADTVNADSATLLIDGVPTAIDMTLGSNHAYMTIKMLEDVSTPAQAELVLSNTMTDMAGNPLEINEQLVWGLPVWQLMTDRLCVVCDDEYGEYLPFMDMDDSDNLVFTWEEFYNEDYENLIAARWNGNGFTFFGQPEIGLLTDTTNSLGVIKLDGQGNPVIARREFSSSQIASLTVTRWNGTEWQDLGTDNLLKDNSVRNVVPAMALDSAGNPVLVWYEGDTDNNDLWAVRWNGQSWESLASAPIDGDTNNNINGVSIALLPDNNPVITWSSRVGASVDNDVWVVHYTGGGWVKYQSEPLDFNESNDSKKPSMVVDSNGAPVVAWLEKDSTTNNVNVAVLENDSFVPLGGGVVDTTQSNIYMTSTAKSKNGTMAVMWTVGSESRVGVKVFLDNAWHDLQPLYLPADIWPQFFSFDIDSHDSTVVVVNDGRNLVYRYNKL